MEYRILGPLDVVDEGVPLAVGRLKERLVLATLLLHANEFVARERLIDELWGATPPPTARKAVNVYVSQLRKSLARNGGDPITTEDGGYRIAVDAGNLDVTRMQQLLADARERASAGELEPAADLLRQALALWRGPTLAGLPFESHGRDEVARLDELRLTALMDRIDCDLALGRHQEVLGELHVLVGEHPLQERLRAQQMLALYRAGRQADALEAYRQARRVLVEELGIDPSEALQRLQQGILRHDPALETPAGTSGLHPPLDLEPRDPGPAPAPSRVRLRPRGRGVTAAALLVLALTAGLVVVSTRAGHTPVASAAPQVVANSIAELDPHSGAVVSDVPVGIEPASMALTRTGLWMVNRGDRTVSRYDLRTHRLHPFGGTSLPYAVATDADGNIWVSETRPDVTWILRTASGSGTSAVAPKTQTVHIPGPSAGAEAVGAGYLWVIAAPQTWPTDADRVSLIDVRSHSLAPSIPLGRAATAITFGFGSAWIGTYDRRHSTAWLEAVRAGSAEPDSIRVERDDGWGPLDVTVGAGSVWVVTAAGSLVRVDPETGRILKRIPMAAREPEFVAFGAGSVWVANRGTFSVTQVDPRTNRVVRTIPLGSNTRLPCGIAATQNAVWIAIGDAYCGTANR